MWPPRRAVGDAAIAQALAFVPQRLSALSVALPQVLLKRAVALMVRRNMLDALLAHRDLAAAGAARPGIRVARQYSATRPEILRKRILKPRVSMKYSRKPRGLQNCTLGDEYDQAKGSDCSAFCWDHGVRFFNGASSHSSC